MDTLGTIFEVLDLVVNWRVHLCVALALGLVLLLFAMGALVATEIHIAIIVAGLVTGLAWNWSAA